MAKYKELYIEYNKIEYTYLDYRNNLSLKNIYRYMKSLIRFHFLFSKYKKEIYNKNKFDIEELKEFIDFIFSITTEYIDTSFGKKI